MRCGISHTVLRPKATSREGRNLTVRRTVLLYCLRQAEGKRNAATQQKTPLDSLRRLGAGRVRELSKRMSSSSDRTDLRDERATHQHEVAAPTTSARPPHSQ